MFVVPSLIVTLNFAPSNLVSVPFMNLTRLSLNSPTFCSFSTSTVTLFAVTTTDFAFSTVNGSFSAFNVNPSSVSTEDTVNVTLSLIPLYPSGAFVSSIITVYSSPALAIGNSVRLVPFVTLVVAICSNLPSEFVTKPVPE